MKLEGLVLESKYAEYIQLIKGPMQKVWKDGFPVDEQEVLPLEFDRYLCVLDDVLQAKEWGEIQREHIERYLERALRDPSFVDFWVHETPKVMPPWPNYNDTHHNQIPVVAQSVGLVREALTYETRGREGGPRESVVKKLSEILNEDVPSVVSADVTEDELLAV